MKKLLIVALTALILCGCSTNTSKKEEEEKQEETKEETKDSNKLDFKDIEYSVYNGLINDKRSMIVELTNNSDFTITYFYFTFTEKDGVTEDQRNAYLENVSKLYDYTLDELKVKGKDKIMFTSPYSDDPIRPGDTVSAPIYYLNNWYKADNEDDFNLSTPDSVKIKYIDKEGNERTTYYDFKNNRQTYEK